MKSFKRHAQHDVVGRGTIMEVRCETAADIPKVGEVVAISDIQFLVKGVERSTGLHSCIVGLIVEPA